MLLKYRNLEIKIDVIPLLIYLLDPREDTRLLDADVYEWRRG